MTQFSPEFLLQWNTCSLVSHWGEFKNYVINNKPLLVAVQETRFLDSDSFNYNFNISGYSLYTHNNNVSPRRGGTALYVSNNILHHQIDLQTTLDVVGVNIKIAQRELKVLSIYLSPCLPFLPNLIKELLSQLPQPYLLLGDFNAHHRTWGCHNTSTRGTQLFNVINSLDLVLLNDMTPTHTHTSTKARKSTPSLTSPSLHLASRHSSPNTSEMTLSSATTSPSIINLMSHQDKQISIPSHDGILKRLIGPSFKITFPNLLPPPLQTLTLFLT